MYKILTSLSQLVGVFLIIFGIVPINNLIVAKTIGGCSDALGFAYAFAGIFLISTLIFINKKFEHKALYVFSAFILACLILYITTLLIQWLYGMPEYCTIFLG